MIMLATENFGNGTDLLISRLLQLPLTKYSILDPDRLSVC